VEALLSEAAQNVINSLHRRRLELVIKLNALQASARRHAFEAVVDGSWKARQDFRAVAEAADHFSDEPGMIDLALTEAYVRLQSRGRDAGDIPHRQAKSKTTKARLRRWLERISNAWNDFQAKFRCPVAHQTPA
jgi:hypothetical protein